MCGIIGILAKDEARTAFSPAELRDRATPLVEAARNPGGEEALAAALAAVEPLVEAAFEPASFAALLADDRAAAAVAAAARSASDAASAIDARLARDGEATGTAAVERWSRLAIRCRDVAWRLAEDLLRDRPKVLALAGLEPGAAVPPRKLILELAKLNAILNGLERLEVRGRDSGGVSVLVTFPDAAAHAAFVARLDAEVRADYAARLRIPDFVDGAVVEGMGPRGGARISLAFTRKVAKEIGELGANVRELRAAIRDDRLLRAALAEAGTSVNPFAHTRWASNGIINLQNCHPVDNAASAAAGHGTPPPRRHVLCAALNGDIDNYQELVQVLRVERGIAPAEAITTDTKVIPLVVDRCLEETGGDVMEAFRLALNRFEGSMAIVMHTSLEPDRTYLALRGSGQALFIGLTGAGYVYASEIYGLVERTSRFLKMNGERERVPGDPTTRGEIWCLQESGAGRIEAIRAISFDGTPLVLDEKQVRRAEITTRDIHRGDHPHYLVKEISESPESVAKTLRGKWSGGDGTGAPLHLKLGEEIVPKALRERLAGGGIRQVVLIGQGTASVAAAGIGWILGRLLAGSPVRVHAMKATELSGFLMDEIDSGTLVIAVSQSGTTTDTNRTVDLARERGAAVVAIVNRRNSDLTYKSDGVLYTSDGRDVEMSVASTKAFYCQVVAGYLLALDLARLLGTLGDAEIARRLGELARLPGLMREVLADAGPIREMAERLAARKRYWAVVGSGPTKVAADEIRIKLSELCYKSIASDTIEDKKHIDLSSEPLILVCAAGLAGSTLADVVKEVSIFKAHKASPVVIARRGETRFAPYAAGVLEVPEAGEEVSLLLCTLVGHLWGYYCARALDEEALPLRRAREATEAALARYVERRATDGSDGFDEGPLHALRPELAPAAREFATRMAAGRFNSGLEVETASRLSLLFKYVLGRTALEDFEQDFGVAPTTDNLLREFLRHLSSGIDELRRPIDAIKHQAKTVTVGVSRIEEAPEGPLADALRAAGVAVEKLGFQDRSSLRALGPAVARVPGSTRYRVSGLDALGEPTAEARIEVVEKRGVAERIASRAESDPRLVGSKRAIVRDRRLFLGVGKLDRRTILILPLLEKGVATGLLLLHLELREDLPLRNRVRVLRGFQNRFEDLRIAAQEIKVAWDDALVGTLPLLDLLTEPVDALADRLARAAVGK